MTAARARTDHKRTVGAYRAERGRFRVVDVPPLQYLVVDGEGDPNTSTAYAEALGALFPVAYALRSSSRRELARDYVVMPLEALWWAPDMTVFTSARDKSRWRWTTMIMVPDWITTPMLDDAVSDVAARRRSPGLEHVALRTLHEGLSVQTLHLGSYDDEGPILARMHDEVIPQAGLRVTGTHHEIYLSDPRRVAPEKLRTILRQPVRRVGPGAGAES